MRGALGPPRKENWDLQVFRIAVLASPRPMLMETRMRMPVRSFTEKENARRGRVLPGFCVRLGRPAAIPRGSDVPNAETSDALGASTADATNVRIGAASSAGAVTDAEEWLPKEFGSTRTPIASGAFAETKKILESPSARPGYHLQAWTS